MSSDQIQLVNGDETEIDSLKFKSLQVETYVKLSQQPFPPQTYTSVLSISNKYGYMISGTHSGIAICSNLKELRSKIESSQPRQKITSEHVKSINLTASPSHIRLSADETKAFVIIGQKLHSYNVSSLLAGITDPLWSFDLDTDPIVDLSPNPESFPDLVAVLHTSGKIVMIDSSKSLKTVFNLPEKVTGMNWSRKGKQICCGALNGKLYQVAPDGKLKKEHPSPPEMDHPVKVQNVYWLEDRVFVALYASIPSEDDEVPETDVFAVSQEGSSAPHVFTRLLDPVATFGDNSRKIYYYIEMLPGWESQAKHIAIFANVGSTDIGVIACDASGSWTNWMLPEGFTITLPLDANEVDTWPVGLAIDFTATESIPGSKAGTEQSIPPCPVLYILNNDGSLMTSTILNPISQVKNSAMVDTLLPLPSAPSQANLAKPTSFSFAAAAVPSSTSSITATTSVQKTTPSPFTSGFGTPSFGTPGFGKPTPSEEPAKSLFAKAIAGTTTKAAEDATTAATTLPPFGKPASAGFNFGASSTSAPVVSAFGIQQSLAKKEDSTKTSGFGFGASLASTNPPASGFGIQQPTAKKEETPSFPTSSTTSSAVGFGIQPPATKKEESSNAQGFGFKVSTPSSSSGVSSFGNQPVSVKKDQPSKPLFGSSAPNSVTEVPSMNKVALPTFSSPKKPVQGSDKPSVAALPAPKDPEEEEQHTRAKVKRLLKKEFEALHEGFYLDLSILPHQLASIEAIMATMRSKSTSSTDVDDFLQFNVVDADKLEQVTSQLKKTTDDVMEKLKEAATFNDERIDALLKIESTLDECKKRINALEKPEEQLSLPSRELGPEAAHYRQQLNSKQRDLESALEQAKEYLELLKKKKTENREGSFRPTSWYSMCLSVQRLTASALATAKKIDAISEQYDKVVASTDTKKSYKKRDTGSNESTSNKAKQNRFGLEGDDEFADADALYPQPKDAPGFSKEIMSDFQTKRTQHLGILNKIKNSLLSEGREVKIVSTLVDKKIPKELLRRPLPVLKIISPAKPSAKLETESELYDQEDVSEDDFAQDDVEDEFSRYLDDEKETPKGLSADKPKTPEAVTLAQTASAPPASTSTSTLRFKVPSPFSSAAAPKGFAPSFSFEKKDESRASSVNTDKPESPSKPLFPALNVGSTSPTKLLFKSTFSGEKDTSAAPSLLFSVGKKDDATISTGSKKEAATETEPVFSFPTKNEPAVEGVSDKTKESSNVKSVGHSTTEVEESSIPTPSFSFVNKDGPVNPFVGASQKLAFGAAATGFSFKPFAPTSTEVTGEAIAKTDVATGSGFSMINDAKKDESNPFLTKPTPPTFSFLANQSMSKDVKKEKEITTDLFGSKTDTASKIPVPASHNKDDDALKTPVSSPPKPSPSIPTSFGKAAIKDAETISTVDEPETQTASVPTITSTTFSSESGSNEGKDEDKKDSDGEVKYEALSVSPIPSATFSFGTLSAKSDSKPETALRKNVAAEQATASDETEVKAVKATDEPESNSNAPNTEHVPPEPTNESQTEFADATENEEESQESAVVVPSLDAESVLSEEDQSEPEQAVAVQDYESSKPKDKESDEVGVDSTRSSPAKNENQRTDNLEGFSDEEEDVDQPRASVDEDIANEPDEQDAEVDGELIETELAALDEDLQLVERPSEEEQENAMEDEVDESKPAFPSMQTSFGFGGFSTQPKNTINPMFDASPTTKPVFGAGSENSQNSNPFGASGGSGSLFAPSKFGSLTVTPPTPSTTTVPSSTQFEGFNKPASSSPSPFGGYAFGQSGFGSGPAAAPSFGGTSIPSSGTIASVTTTSLFGTSSTPSTFGSSGFGNSNPTQSAFGSSSSGFGSKPTQAAIGSSGSSGLVGSSQTQSGFGFGNATSSSQSAFGSTGYSSSNPAAAPTSLLAAASNTSTPALGQSSSSSSQQTPPAPLGSGFGSSGFGFGASSALVNNSPFASIASAAKSASTGGFASFAQQSQQQQGPQSGFGSFAAAGSNNVSSVFGSTSSSSSTPKNAAFSQYRG